MPASTFSLFPSRSSDGAHFSVSSSEDKTKHFTNVNAEGLISGTLFLVLLYWLASGKGVDATKSGPPAFGSKSQYLRKKQMSVEGKVTLNQNAGNLGKWRTQASPKPPPKILLGHENFTGKRGSNHS